jgi:hypothetical protein
MHFCCAVKSQKTIGVGGSNPVPPPPSDTFASGTTESEFLLQVDKEHKP